MLNYYMYIISSLHNILLSICLSVCIFTHSCVNEENDNFLTGSSDWKRLAFDVQNVSVFRLLLAASFTGALQAST